MTLWTNKLLRTRNVSYHGLGFPSILFFDFGITLEGRWWDGLRTIKLMHGLHRTVRHVNNYHLIPNGQTGRHFADDIFTCNLMNQYFFCISIQFSLTVVPRIDSNSWLVQVMAWSRTGHRLNRCRSNSLMHICGIRREGAVNDAVAFTIALQDLFLCGGHHLRVRNVFHKCKSVTDVLFFYYCIYSLFTITSTTFKYILFCLDSNNQVLATNLCTTELDH